MYIYTLISRYVVTTVSLVKTTNRDDDDKARLILNQVAEKDALFNLSSEIIFEACGDSLVMTTTVQTDEGYISGTRTFSRYDLDELLDTISIPDRRSSLCMAPNISRRGSFATSNHLRGSDDIPEIFLQNLATRSRRRSSIANIPEHLLPQITKTEASNKDSDNSNN